MRRRLPAMALATVLAGSALTAALPVAAQPSVSTLTKSVQGVADPAAHGDVATWVVSYSSGANGAATITDTIGAGQTLVSGSLRVPPGWTGTEGNPVSATNPNVRNGGTALSSLLTPPVQASASSTGGDGFTPILHRTPDGRLQAWNVYHHVAEAGPKLVCTDLTTSALCAGGPWPKPLNTTPGPFGAGNTGDIASPLEPQYVRDPANAARVYYSATTASSIGVACLDLAAPGNCGYWPLMPRSGATFEMAGLVEAGGNLYGVATSGHVVCWAIATRGACAGQPYAPVVPPTNHGGYYLGALAVAGGKLFASSSQQGARAPVLGCFDPATAAACAGWPAPKPLGPFGNFSYNAYTAYSTTGAEVGACSSTTGGQNVTTCYAVDGSSLPAPSAPAGLESNVISFNPEVIRTGDRVRSYLGIWGGPYSGAAVCHDWSTGASCAGLPARITHPTVNGGDTRDYGYAHDAPTGCLIGLGDAGVLFSMDPDTGASPCVRSGASVSLNPAQFYCDGKPHDVTYGKARLTGVTPANVNFGASTVKAVDQGGNPVSTPGFAPDGTVDLTGVSAASLTVTASIVLNNASDFGGGNQPALVVEFTGDAPQICFRTNISAECSVTSVANTAGGTDATGGFTSNTVTRQVAPGASCLPNVVVNKEICGSHTPAHCKAGGSGPWVKQAPVGVLGLLHATAYWRITVTNNGPIAVTDAYVLDDVEPSCHTGPFSLQPGESKRVHCSTYALLSLFPLINEAKAKYTPVNGTRLYTAWSSAKACSLLCALN
ncbi:DUF7617 domain-containing protein [Lentzea jiangxiensis]|uniref:DUF7617 domain-containing protein n=1 Tax=Lentzea jiangxiensis TaxID=641025 RepID=A0A1H0JJG3_9PSEU|nr:hypothetical protein [Lentzea jiangxiensis]SDO43660.1 hypothetical protein SAMN05421507_102525 [Lentzea jiangxiensis]